VLWSIPCLRFFASLCCTLIKRSVEDGGDGNFVVIDLYHDYQKYTITTQVAGNVTTVDRIKGLHTTMEKCFLLLMNSQPNQTLYPKAAERWYEMRKEAEQLYYQWKDKPSKSFKNEASKV
jgi:hypothetical protein